MRTYLAIDIGASSGRHILGRLGNGRMLLEEVYRFPNGMTEHNGSLCWDIDALIAEVAAGTRQCGGQPSTSIGIDTWGVDFVLLDADGRPVGPAVAYRDGRTGGMDAEVERLLPYPEHFARTGIQKQLFNTVYQLMALKVRSPELLARATSLMLMPDYLRFRLSGERRTEYTIASTTGLLNAQTREWDFPILDRLGFPRRLFAPVTHGLTPGHDTACAFLAASPKDGNAVYISSGTWSLLGVLSGAPILTGAAREAGFSNEGGYGGTIRFLKNIMGLWMIQSIRQELPGTPSFEELSQLARQSTYDGLVNVNDDIFFAPEHMTRAVAEKCAEAGAPPPNGTGDILRCVYRSLAFEYARSIRELAGLTGRRITSVSIIGGGCKDRFLNTLTAQASGLPVYAGPAECTAIGNILSQMLRSGELPDIEAAHEIVRNSFPIEEIRP